MTEEVKIKVRLDVEQAKRDVKQMDDAVRSAGEAVKVSMSDVLAAIASSGVAVGAATFRTSLGQLAGAGMTGLDMAGQALLRTGREGGIGRAISAGAAQMSAMDRARQMTASMFGPVGENADPEMVYGMYRQILAIESRISGGEARVSDIIAGKQTEEVASAMVAAVSTIAPVMAELLNWLRGVGGMAPVPSSPSAK